MISTPEKPQAEPCNFFLLPHGTNTEFRHLDDVVDKIQTMQQDAYTLNNIIQRHDLDRTLDKNSVINDTSLSNMADLAASINQALNRILRLEFLNGTSIPEIQVVASSRSRPRRRAKKH
ncbi:hypothetical protein NW762_004625 [Fusarium torreyae]|uniref:Uncharacterized protein n=1 Tax=Fusarium torreyae TaxID=1237075 RepID=A0A9W8VJ79_9HYPO|nr:hypothetical protein NW762_004625 [Fusarium torreyae]